MDTVAKFAAALAGVENPAPIVEEFAAIAAKEVAGWKLIAAQWNDYYRYSHGSIDFTMPGLCGVVARNCAGKTTIIDIVSLGLFNSPRGKRVDAIRNGAARASMTIEFEIDAERYMIQREDTRAVATVRLYRAGEEIGASLRTIYSDLECLIGTRERFMYLTLYDPAHDLFALSPLERQRTLPGILGLALCDDLCEQYTREAREHQRAIVLLGAQPSRVDIDTLARAAPLGERPSNKWRSAISKIPKQPAAAPIQCEPEDLVPRVWPAKDIMVAIKTQGFWPTAEELAGLGHAGDIPALFAEWKGLDAARKRTQELSARTKYNFNSACSCCAATRSIIAADLAAAVAAESKFSPTARENLSAAIVAELRAERAKGVDTLPGKMAWAVSQAAAEAAADAEWCERAREADRADAAIAAALAENLRADKYDEAAPRLRAAYTRAQVAAKLLKSEEFRMAAVAEKMSAVMSKINALIAQAAGGFTMEFELAPEPTFWIIETGSYRSEIARGSGYQKFLAGVCCRLALSGFVIIDEGFGVVDPEHMGPLLSMLRAERAFVFGHTEELARAIDSPIVINVSGAVSSIGAPAKSAIPQDILELIAPITSGSTRAYECVCGSSITNAPASISAHNKTAKHKKFIAGHN